MAGTGIKWINKSKVLSLFKRMDRGLLKEIRDTVHGTMYWDVLPKAKRNVNRVFKNKSGNLSNSLSIDVETRRDKIIATLFANLKLAPYARIQEFGGIIKPKKAKYLWIPIFGTKGSPGRKKGMFVITRKADGKKFAGKTGKDGKFKAMYVLVDQVKISAKPYMEPALRWGVPRIIKEIKAITEKDFK